MVDNDLVGLLGIYAMRDIGRYMKTATRKMICPLSSRQGAYLIAYPVLFHYLQNIIHNRYNSVISSIHGQAGNPITPEAYKTDTKHNHTNQYF